jgi:hypothetical protein
MRPQNKNGRLAESREPFSCIFQRRGNYFYNAGLAIGPNIDPAALQKIYQASGLAQTLDTGGYFDDIENISAAFVQ